MTVCFTKSVWSFRYQRVNFPTLGGNMRVMMGSRQEYRELRINRMWGCMGSWERQRKLLMFLPLPWFAVECLSFLITPTHCSGCRDEHVTRAQPIRVCSSPAFVIGPGWARDPSRPGRQLFKWGFSNGRGNGCGNSLVWLESLKNMNWKMPESVFVCFVSFQSIWNVSWNRKGKGRNEPRVAMI